MKERLHPTLPHDHPFPPFLLSPSGTIEEVRQVVMQELSYQSSLELQVLANPCQTSPRKRTARPCTRAFAPAPP